MSAANAPDLWDPAIGWDKTMLSAPSSFMWFFTLEVSVIVMEVFQVSCNWLKTSCVFLGGTETIIRSTFSPNFLLFTSSKFSTDSSIIFSFRASFKEGLSKSIHILLCP